MRSIDWRLRCIMVVKLRGQGGDVDKFCFCACSKLNESRAITRGAGKFASAINGMSSVEEAGLLMNVPVYDVGLGVSVQPAACCMHARCS